MVDENDRCFLGKTPYGLTDMLGLRRKEIDGLYDGESNVMVPENKWKKDSGKNGEPGSKGQKGYACANLYEILDVWNARTLLVYGEDFYGGTPAVTKNCYGRGTVCYVAADGEQRLYDDLLKELADTAGVVPIVAGEIPESV